MRDYVDTLNRNLAIRDPGRAAQVQWVIGGNGTPELIDRPGFTNWVTRRIKDRRERESERNQQRAGIGRYSDPRQGELGGE